MGNPKRVYICGVFDGMHEGHLNIIKKASLLGNLTVGIVKDAAVKKQKGEGRPLMSQQHRYNLIAELRCVTYPRLIEDFSFPESVFEDFDLICLGEDQHHFSNIKDIPFEKLIILPRTPNVSTTELIKKLKG